MGKKSSPKAPDPSSVAAAQGAANKEAVDASAKDTQINQVGPQGSIRYSGDVGSPDRTVTTTLSPAEQQQLDQQNQVAGTLGQKAIGLSNDISNQGSLNYDGLTQVPTNYDQLRSDATNKVYQGMTQNLNRDFNRSDETLRSKLAAQGLNANDEAFNRETGTLNDSKNTALNNAASTAFQYGQGEANNAYNQATQSRNQQIGERTNLYNQPINELSAIIQGTPALNATSPAPINTGQFTQAPVNVAGITDNAYQSQLAQSNQRAGKLGGTASNLGGLGLAAYSAFSAAELKEFKQAIPDDDSILEKLLTLPIETWNYKPEIAAKIPGDNGERHIGCYAEDFQKTFGIGDGMTINFIDCMGVIMQSIKELAAKIEKLER